MWHSCALALASPALRDCDDDDDDDDDDIDIFVKCRWVDTRWQ
jgi:hypothetical protein